MMTGIIGVGIAMLVLFGVVGLPCSLYSFAVKTNRSLRLWSLFGLLSIATILIIAFLAVVGTVEWLWPILFIILLGSMLFSLWVFRLPDLSKPNPRGEITLSMPLPPGFDDRDHQ